MKKKLIEDLEIKGNKLSPIMKASIEAGVTFTMKDIEALRATPRVEPRTVICFKCDREYVSDMPDADKTKCAWCYL